jgi:aerobic carbon-monoxide dehydrogenase large subunit
MGDAQGRDNVTTARMALAEDGKFLGMDVDLMGDMGAYLSTFGPYIPHGGAGMLPGLYDIQAFHCRVRTVFTNTVPVDAYRGAGRPEAAYVIERLVDASARKLGMAPDAIRRKNFIAPRAMPYKTATGKVYDSGDFTAHMKRAMEIANWKEFPKRAKAAKKQGLVRGIGLGTYVEVCGTMGEETANVALDPNGDVTILIGTQSSGQGHQTAYAQIVAEQFGLAPERVHIFQGDTDRIATGLGTGGSASVPTGGVCVERATRALGTNLREIAAEALETSVGDLEISDGIVRIAGTDRSISFADLAKRPGVDPSKLKAASTFTSADGTYPNGTHLAEVEIDPATGMIAIIQYVIVDDFGVTLNPLLLAGQVHGGAMQGIGQALMEQAVYDPKDGQLVTGTFMDYALPRAADGPSFVFETHNVPCKTNPMGVKGAGEAGAIGSCPAVVNAIIEGLWREYKIDHIDMPATPERVWIAIREHQRQHNL